MLFLPIETKVREYHGKLLLSLVAAEKGFEVILGGQRNVVETVHHYERGIYLDKSVASTKRKWSKWCEKLGLTNVVHDEEGLVYFDDDIYHELRICKEVLDRTTLFFTWGQAQQKTILGKLPACAHLLSPVGNPRFDMMRSEIRRFYSSASEKLTDRYGRIILINTNFGYYNHHNGVEAERKRLNHYPIAQKRPEFFDGWINAQEKMFYHFKEMLPKLCRKFPEHTIILRPHPSENKKVWENITDSLPNCHVNSDGNVLEWIYSSEVLIHFNCTTAIEAYLLDVPAIAYRPESLDSYEQVLPNKLSIKAGDLDELLFFVKQAQQKNIPGYFLGEDPERTGVIRYYLSSVSGELAADRMIDKLLFLDIAPSRKRGAEQIISVLWRRVWLLVKKIKEKSRGQDGYDKQKFPGIDLSELQNDIKQLQTITGRFKNVTVTEVRNNCFCIKPASL